MTNSDKSSAISERLKQLSPEKRRLLAHRLSTDSTRQSKQSNATTNAFLTTDQPVDQEALEQHLQRQLPRYMLPSQIIVLDQLPRTPNGKLDRNALKAAAVTARPHTQPTRGEAAARTDQVDAELTAIWCNLLNLERIAPDDSFFDLGGHSLLAIRMLAQVKAAFHVDIPVALIVDSPTIRRLAAYLRDVTAAQQAGSISVMQDQGDGTPLYFLPLHRHGVLHYRHLKANLGTDRPLYGFDGFEVPDSDAELPTVEALAAAYVDELLTFQPQGPYVLCGISIAGLIAFEMARQLRARGVDGVHVLLFDTHGPGYPAHLSGTEVVRQTLASLIHPPTLAHMLALWGDFLINALANIYSSEAVTWARSRLSTQAEAEDSKSEFNSDAINRQLGKMTRDYFAQQRDYDGDLILYRASLQSRNVRYNRTLGWEKFVRGNIRVEIAHGDHLGILKRRNSSHLAKHVRWLLGELDML